MDFYKTVNFINNKDGSELILQTHFINKIELTKC